MDIYQARRLRVYFVLMVGFVLFGQAVLLPQAVPLARTPERKAVQAVSPVAKQVARQLLTPSAFACFDKIMVRESHWNPRGDNPTSSARGVGQLLDTTYTNLGMRHSSSALAQTVAALAYISRHYGPGGPCKAWAYWQRHSNY